MNSIELTQINQSALAMISKAFYVEHLNASHPDLRHLGNCRVTSVVVHESEPPEIGLIDSHDHDIVQIYPLDELKFLPAVAANGERASAREAPCSVIQQALNSI